MTPPLAGAAPAASVNVGVAYIGQLHTGMQQAQSLPPLAFNSESWPQPSPFHNRGFPDQHNFVGRAALLRATKKALDAGRDVALTQPVAMHGAGGIGKTRAAVEFARAHGSSYTLRLFLDAQSPDSLRASLADTATKLRLTDDPQASTEALVLLALRLLRAVPTALVVADNADTPEALEAVRALCHQPGGVRWLITTRLTDLGDEFAPQRVDLLSETEATKLLQQRARKNRHNPGGDAAARAIAIELGCLPLALQQAAAYVARHRLAWPHYSTLLATNPAEALSQEAREMKDVPESILRTYTISIAQLTPLAREMLEAACQLAPAAIPETVFLNEDDHHTRRSALVELADLSLLEWQASKLEVHRAIAIALNLGLSLDKRRQVLESACFLVSACVPEDMEHPDHWPAWADLRPHIEHLLALVGPAGAEVASYMWLLAHWPIYLCAIGEYSAAVGYYRAVVACLQRTRGVEHPETLSVRNNLGLALQGLGKYDEAEQEHRAVVHVQQRVLKAEDPDILSSRNNLAIALYHQGKYDEAEQEHRARIKIEERVFGVDVHRVLSSRNNLAQALQGQGKYDEAEQEFRSVLAALQLVLGAKHPETLASRANLASTLQAQGRYAEAEQEFRKVLALQEEILGAEHPDTLGVRMNLANALAQQYSHAEVEQEYRAVLQICERVLGTEHPDTLTCRNNLVCALNDQGKHAEAEQEHRAVLAVRERLLGAEHPHTLASRNNLANSLYTQGRYGEAEQEYRAVLQGREHALGAEHAVTLKSRMNLALAQAAQGRCAEAEQEYRTGLQIQERMLSSEHPDVAMSCCNLALCLLSQHKLPEALQLMQRAERIRQKVYGPDHQMTQAATTARQRIETALNSNPHPMIPQ